MKDSASKFFIKSGAVPIIFAFCFLFGESLCNTAAFAGDIVNPGDQLSVTVYNHPELSQQLRVDSTGGLSLTVGGYLTVKGKSLSQVAAEITKRLNAF